MKIEIILDTVDFLNKVHRELQLTLSDKYDRLWLKRGFYNKKQISDLGKDKNAIFDSLIGETILDNAVFLKGNENQISWEHELLLDWFIAKGILFDLDYHRESTENKIEVFSDKISSSDIIAEGLLSIALFLYEMLEARSEGNTYMFVLVLTAIARAYHFSKESENICKFATLAISGIDEGVVDIYPEWKKAELINDNAYMILSSNSNESEMGYGFDYDKCGDYLKQALKIIEAPCDDKENERRIRLTEAKIHGNLGAFCQAKYRSTKELLFIEQAVGYHEKGLELREMLFEDFPDMADKDRHIGTSYHCLATDYYYMGELERSLEYHRLAIEYREKSELHDIPKVESYMRCVGTFNRLLTEDGSHFSEYIKKTIELYSKALRCKHSFLKNRLELNNLISNCKETIRLFKEQNETAGDDNVAYIRSIAMQVDKLCEEVSITSDLVALIE